MIAFLKNCRLVTRPFVSNLQNVRGPAVIRPGRHATALALALVAATVVCSQASAHEPTDLPGLHAQGPVSANAGNVQQLSLTTPQERPSIHQAERVETLAVAITPDPSSPEIGQQVLFSLSNLSGEREGRSMVVRRRRLLRFHRDCDLHRRAVQRLQGDGLQVRLRRRQERGRDRPLGRWGQRERLDDADGPVHRYLRRRHHLQLCNQPLECLVRFRRRERDGHRQRAGGLHLDRRVQQLLLDHRHRRRHRVRQRTGRLLGGSE